MTGGKGWSFLPVGAGSWGNCNRFLQPSLLHLQNMHVFMELDYYARKLRFQEKQLGGQRSYLRLAEREYELIDKDIKLVESMYTRDSILYVRKAMIAAEFEESGSRYLQSLRSKEEVRMSCFRQKCSWCNMRRICWIYVSKHTMRNRVAGLI